MPYRPEMEVHIPEEILEDIRKLYGKNVVTELRETYSSSISQLVSSSSLLNNILVCFAIFNVIFIGTVTKDWASSVKDQVGFIAMLLAFLSV